MMPVVNPMMTKDSLLRSALQLALLLVLASCGGGPRRANIPSGSMPTRGSFTGVWNSPQYGEMHLVQSGNDVIGEYVRDERRGRIEGHALGRVLRFVWTERSNRVVGHATETSGHGYFVYRIDENEVDHHLEGEWGHDDDEVGGGQWTATRDRRNRQPQVGHVGREDELPQGDDFGDEPTEGGAAPAAESEDLGDL